MIYTQWYMQAFISASSAVILSCYKLKYYNKKKAYVDYWWNFIEIIILRVRLRRGDGKRCADVHLKKKISTKSVFSWRTYLFMLIYETFYNINIQKNIKH